MSQEIKKKSSFLRSIKVVAWSFIGIRSSSGYRDDLAKVNPLHVVLVGIAGALLLIVGLMGLVGWVVGS
ncbi:DUF2970 domain-containing protein [Rhodoferax sp. OV413]|uniref:DUF2970 domain-containing protein n=1 Tax=Rhodoferax sp. OV413 TaxID=1855285 RepID=UPI0025D4EB70|nr:DUF2970 domain-containing protein [Rhodoferax sp. OV413]